MERNGADRLDLAWALETSKPTPDDQAFKYIRLWGLYLLKPLQA